jgi:hypothetical protein
MCVYHVLTDPASTHTPREGAALQHLSSLIIDFAKVKRKETGAAFPDCTVAEGVIFIS